MKNIKTLMVGSDLSVKGGMVSVVQRYKQTSFMDSVIYRASYCDGSALKRIRIFGICLGQFMFDLCTKPSIRIVHIHMSEKGSFIRKSLVLTLAKLWGKKTILHLHGAEFLLFYQKSPAFFQKYITHILTSADHNIALSAQWRKDILQIADKTNISVIYNPCIVQEKPVRQTERIRFLFMGRMGQRKGVYDLIEACKLLKNRHIQINLYGDGEVDQVRRLVEENNLSDFVNVHDWIRDAEKLQAFQASHVLLLPSYNEGLPMAILEALGYWMPVISTPVGGIPEAIIDGVNGFLIEPGNVVQLAEKMDTLSTSPELIETMGEASYQMAKEKFDLNRTIHQLESLYKSLV